MFKSSDFSRRILLFVLWFVSSFASTVLGADTAPVSTKKLITGLKNPHGVAVRPEGSGESYEVFVAESGAGRVVKFRNDKPEKRTDVVSGFSTKPANEDSPLTAGVRSLHFLDHMRLVVAGGDDDGVPFVRLYELPEPESPLTSDQHKHEAAVPERGKVPNFDAHVFRNIAHTQPNDRVGDFLLVAAPTVGESIGLVYVPVRSGTLGELAPTRLKNGDNGFQIDGIAVGRNGYVVVATSSIADSVQPSQLTFFNPLDRRIVLQVPTDLSHIVALAYSPKTGNLFAANAPSTDDGRAGIYRIDDANKPGGAACTLSKIADIRNTTALAFGPDGALYVAALGDSKGKADGSLLKLTGDL